MGKLIVTRSRQPVTSLWLYQIMIDGQQLATISHGQTALIELPAGHHEVVARSGWCRSKPLEIEVGPQGNHYAEVGSIMSWWYLLFIFSSCLAISYLHNAILFLALFMLCVAPAVVLLHRFLYLRTITASEAAVRRGSAIPHPDALPAIRLTHDLLRDHIIAPKAVAPSTDLPSSAQERSIALQPEVGRQDLGTALAPR